MTTQDNISDAQELRQWSQGNFDVQRSMSQADPNRAGVARGETYGNYEFPRPTVLKAVNSRDVPLDLPLDLPVNNSPFVDTRERHSAPTLHKKKGSYDLRDDFQNAELTARHCRSASATSGTTDAPPNNGRSSEGPSSVATQ